MQWASFSLSGLVSMHAIWFLVLLYVLACSPLYSAGSKTRQRSETKHESSIPLTIRFEPPILLEMLTRFNDADEGNQLKGSQRQAHNIGWLIGEGCACKSQLESSFSLATRPIWKELLSSLFCYFWVDFCFKDHFYQAGIKKPLLILER